MAYYDLCLTFIISKVVKGRAQARRDTTLYNSADSVPTSNLVCIQEVANRNTFSHRIYIAEMFYYTCSLVTDIHCTRYKRQF